MAEFQFEGHRLHFDSYGEGDRALLMIHGLLMNGRMFTRFGPELASHGYRVICPDLLGHGLSDRPDDLRLYSMARFADQVAALLDHLGLDEAVIGGTSLGANVSLEFAARHPERARGLIVEMPVLDSALTAVAMAFTPVMAALKLGAPVVRLTAALTRRIQRSHYLIDIGLDWLRQDPGPSLAVLEGLLLARICPPRDEREAFDRPALVVGHTADPVHPFSDADMLVEEMPNARMVEASSILEWRINPGRLDRELAGFLAELYSPHALRDRSGTAA